MDSYFKEGIRLLCRKQKNVLFSLKRIQGFPFVSRMTFFLKTYSLRHCVNAIHPIERMSSRPRTHTEHRVMATVYFVCRCNRLLAWRKFFFPAQYYAICHTSWRNSVLSSLRVPFWTVVAMPFIARCDTRFASNMRGQRGFVLNQKPVQVTRDGNVYF